MNKIVFQSTKIIDGFSTCFRQWKATHTHCRFLHGYSISFHVTFEGTIDYCNWVVDFGFLKRSKTLLEVDVPNGKVAFNVGEWFKHMFDHTVVLAEDDPYLEHFEQLSFDGVVQLRVIPKVGCEMFAAFVYETLNDFLYKETGDRVRVIRVECFEHEKNSAIVLSK